MKYLIIILFLTFISCKREAKTKTESELEAETEAQMEADNGIEKSVIDMWNEFTKSNPEFEKEELPDTDFFDNNEEGHK
ncbi:MAG: hypothetical protein NWQ38_05520 [Cellulophaga sp.]|nr:hypothetical protein [Cellulophaga sp.]